MPYYAIVTAVHPEAHSIDVRMQDGRELPGVPVLSPSAASDSGCSNLPAVNEHNKVYAIIDFVDREAPFAYGFLFPQLTQTLFRDNRAMFRHHSGAHITIDEQANIEVKHPSGAYVLLGENTEPAAMAGQDIDGKWMDDKNTGKTPFIILGNGSTKITLDKDGNITVSGTAITITGTVTVTGDVVADGISLKTHSHGNGNNGDDTTGPK